ncbi:hypothetical protein A9Q75_17335 [Colwellia psychrerythraea]|uniref:Uncharacterized protein n=1 Tax=Colwellia psychrerythraea TaxID=28229 RepID=A0A1Y5E0M0_COLPS|nr:hypothetical protein A9Q75_17335 [Colwellia psychrerythraea]
MDKNYCAVNTKYFKDNNLGAIAHILRKMIDNKNTVECLSKNNFGYVFGDGDIEGNYKAKLEKARKANKYVIQKDSNTFIDSVLVFDAQRFNECLREGKQDEIEQATKDFMNEFKENYGFEPVGFEFHMDEGTIIDTEKLAELDEDEQKKYIPIDNPDEDFTTEHIKHNAHAHAIFLNYDFEQNKTCLRFMTRKDWGDSQDLLHKHFQKFGFDRGEKKQTSKKDHKTKADYVRELELKTIEMVESHSKNLQEKNNLLDQVIDHQNYLNRFDDLAFYAKKIKGFVLDFQDKNPKLISSILKISGAEKLKDMAISIYDTLTKKSDLPPVLIEEIKPLKKEEIKNIEVDIEEKKKHIKKINNRRKYSNKPNKDI